MFPFNIFPRSLMHIVYHLFGKYSLFWIFQLTHSRFKLLLFLNSSFLNILLKIFRSDTVSRRDNNFCMFASSILILRISCMHFLIFSKVKHNIKGPNFLIFYSSIFGRVKVSCIIIKVNILRERFHYILIQFNNDRIDSCILVVIRLFPGYIG